MQHIDRTTPAILVLDDDEDFAEGLKELLEHLNYRVQATNSLDTARDVLSDPSVRIALVDLKLGALNGLEVVRALSEAWPDRIFIVITAYSSIDSAIQAIQVGAYDYLRKPFGAEQVDAVLRRAIDRLGAEDARIAAESALAGANRELRQINQRLSHLVKLTRGFAGCSQLSSLYPQMLSAFSKSMGAEGGSIYAVTGSELRLVASLDPGHATERLRLPLDPASVIGRVMASGKPILVESVSEEPNLNPSGWQGYRNDSSIAFPLVGAAGELMAVVTLHSKGTPPFSRTDMELGVILAGHVCESLRAANAFERMESSEKRFRHLAEGSVQGIFVCDEEKLYYANAAFLEITGAKGKKAGDRVEPLEEMLPSNVRQCLRDGTWDSGNRAGPKQRMIEFQNESGEPRWVELMVQTVRWDERAALQVTITDRTDRYLAEKRLRDQQRQLVQADKLASLGTLLSGIAHEINNPMNVIGLSAEMLELRWSELQSELTATDPSDGDSRLAGATQEALGRTLPDATRRILDAVDRVKHIIDRVRDHSRQSPESQRMAVDVNQVVQSAIDLSRSEINRCTRAFTFSPGVALPAIAGDRIELAQVIVNLIVNACQALPDVNGAVHVSTSFVERSQSVEIHVIDEGSGIDESVLSSVFDPFFTTKLDTGGSGLGLYISYQIVNDHGGKLSLGPREGGGTWACVSLPCDGAVQPPSD